MQLCGGYSLQLILLHAGMQRTGHLIESCVHTGGSLHHDLDLVLVFDLTGGTHDFFAIAQLITSLRQFRHQLAVDLVYTDGGLWIQMIFLHHHSEIRLKFIQMSAIHAPAGRQSAKHCCMSGIGPIFNPRAVNPLIGDLGAESKNIRFAAAGDNGIPSHIIDFWRGYRRGCCIPFVLCGKQNQAGKVRLFQELLNPSLAVLPHSCKVNPVFIIDLHRPLGAVYHFDSSLRIYRFNLLGSFGIPRIPFGL